VSWERIRFTSQAKLSDPDPVIPFERAGLAAYLISRSVPAPDHDNLPRHPWAGSDTRLREAMTACSQGTASAPRSGRTRDSSPPSRTCSRAHRIRHPARKARISNGCLPGAPSDIAGNEYGAEAPCGIPSFLIHDVKNRNIADHQHRITR